MNVDALVLVPNVSVYELLYGRADFPFRLRPLDSTLPLRTQEVANTGAGRVPVTLTALREGEPSPRYIGSITNSITNSAIAVWTENNPTSTQWFRRDLVYLEVIAQVYEYTEPRMGVTSWPTISETASTLMFDIGGQGFGQIAILPATIEIGVSVDKIPAVRETLIVEKMADGQWRVAGHGLSETSSQAILDLQVTSSGVVYALALDDYGITFVPGLSVKVGQKIRPTVMAGWVYLVTEAGVLPTQEPVWWSETIKYDHPLGTARAVVKRYYPPQCHGPVPVTLTAA